MVCCNKYGYLPPETLREISFSLDLSLSNLQFTLETVACIAACGLAPVIMINDDTHGRLTAEKVHSVLGCYKKW